MEQEESTAKKSLRENLAEMGQGLLGRLPTLKREKDEVPAPANGQGLSSLIVSKGALVGMNISDAIADGVRTARKNHDADKEEK